MKEMTGARESNAGDDFHFIWSAKKALKLLEPHTDFEALCVEGPNIEDSIVFEDDGNALLSIDVAEYFGGRKYKDATKVIFSQLKYSTRHGDLPWTFSSLSATTNSKKDNSIIQRLAQTYKGFLKKYPKDIEKLQLKLVTNREIDEKFKNQLNKYHETIEESNCTKYIELKRLIPQKDHQHLKLFYENTKLSSAEFIGFIKSIDFSECGTGIRDIQESEVITSLAKLGILDLKANYDKLIQFIRKQMSPEENEAEPIDKNIVASFFNTIPDSLFPASSQIIKPQQYVKRDVSADIVKEIVINRMQHICLHATGGIGKTSVISDLENSLPSGSEVLLYDCFGGGSYLDPSTPLHTYKNAIIQLSNELALKCYTPFLVRTNLEESEYLKSLSTRLYQASDYVKKINQNAVILVILDAVDNSYSASEVLGDRCFADKLMKITLPENVAILVTSRTERLNKFELPYGTVQIELKGFSKKEQRNYIDMFYKNVSDIQSEEIRQLTNGNPRVQYYVFSKISHNIGEALEYLNPNGKNLKGIFEDAIRKVDSRISSEMISFEELCRALVELPRPIPVDIITSSTDYNTEKLASACSEYLIGVYFGNGIITFRDEDFEEYLRTTAKSSESAIMKIAETLYNRRLDDYYSIKYLHIFLEKAKKLDEILSSIYTTKNISIPLIEDEKNEIISKRIKSAFSIDEICNEKYRLDAYKLLYIQTKCKATDAGVKEIILENMGLAKKLGFESTIDRYILVKSEFHSLSELTLQTYTNSLLEDYKLADQFFKSSLIKINQYKEEKDTDRNLNHRVEKIDISRLAIYIAMRYGAKDAVKWLHRWSPYPSQGYYDVTYSLLLHGFIEKAELIIGYSDDIDMFAACAVAFVELNYSIKDEFWTIGERLIKHIEKEKQINVTGLKYRINLMEMLLKRRRIKEATNIADNTEVAIDYSYISFYEMNGELPKEYAFRFYALKKYLKGEEYCFDDFWSPDSQRYERYTESEIRERRNELKKILDFIINSFFIRLKMIDSNNTPRLNMDDFNKEWSNCERGSYQFYNDHNSYDYYRIITRNIFCMLLSRDKNTLKKFCKVFQDNRYLDNNFHFKIIGDIIKDKKYIDLAAWYLKELDAKMNKYPQSAYDLKKFYLDCSNKAILIDRRLAYDYFLKAINATTGVDEEAYRRIDLFKQLSENYRADNKSSELVYNFVRIIEDSYKRLDDNKHLPKSNIYKLLTKVHPSSAIAAACRLEDRDDDYVALGFEISIPYIIEQLLQDHKISVETATALSNIDIKYGESYNNIVNIILARLRGESIKKTERIIQVISYDIEKLSGGFENGHIIEKIYEWSKDKYDDSIDCIKKLNDEYCFIEKKFRNTELESYVNEKLCWDNVDKNTIKQNKKSLISTMDSMYYKDRGKLVEFVFENTAYENQLSVIELLLDIMYTTTSCWENDECFEILIDYLNEWGEYNPRIMDWREDKRKLDEILELYSQKTESFKEKNLHHISRMFLIDNDTILSKMVKNASSYLCYEPWRIFSYIESLSSIDDCENCSQLLEWCCAEEITNVHPASGDEVYKASKRNIFSIEESLAIYLIKMLGHVEKEKRWYAMHAIYSLYKLKEGQIIDKIIELIFDDNIPELYKDKQYVYYKDSAIIYLLVALRKIVEEDVLIVIKYLPVLEHIALTNKTINILQRQLAKEIIMIIRPSKKVEISCDVVSKKIVKYQPRKLYNKEKKSVEFHFDTLDIVPKVYYYLGQIFQKSEGKVMEDCDKIISSWGITNDTVAQWNEQYKTSEYSKNSYGLGTSVEDLSKYVQYNAMYYIADEYRKTQSISNDENPIYTFEGWIQSWLTNIQGSWVSDLKSLPPKKEIFLDMKRYVQDAKYVIDDGIFHKSFWHVHEKQKYFILYNNSSIEYKKSRKAYSMSIGIMDKKFLNKLLEQVRMLNYWIEWSFISDEDHRCDDRFIEDVTGEYYGKDSSFETFDPYTNEMNYSLLKPSKDIEHFLKIDGTSPADYCITKNNSYPIKTQYWSYSNDDRMYNLISKGNMLFIKEGEFLSYLKSKPNTVVIAQMNIRYSDAYDKYDDKAEEAERRRIIILDNKLQKVLKEIEIKI
ncbi:MAG: hypothetical protein N4A68_04570 [Maledivibacter sp.]|jgi:hypothetical protein|nr:hypothetical protein [Maledivibacter sp.]